MFGGPIITECAPWDLSCTLNDQFGNQSSVTRVYPWMKNLPKSTITKDDLAFQEYIIYLKYDLDLWQRGLRGESLTQREKAYFYKLGTLAMGSEGFNDLYQSMPINNKI